MNKAIKAIQYAGLSLKDFRNKSKSGRLFMWMLIVANIEMTSLQELSSNENKTTTYSYNHT